MKSQTKFQQTEIGEIPEDWDLLSVSKIANIISGGTPKTSVKEYWNGNIPWLSVVDFNKEQKKVYETEKSITEKGLKNSSTNILKKGSLIISARGTVGALAQLGRDMAFNQSCYGLDANKSLASNEYLYYALKNWIDLIKQKTHGSVFSTIIRSTFNDVYLPIPNLSEQQQIASILSSLDDKIELNRRMNKTLEEIGKALFKRWFVDFEFPNENGEPYKSSGGEMVESELGMIPKGWKITRLGNIIEIASGKRPDDKSDIKTEYYHIPIIGASGIMGYTSKVLFYKRIICIGRVGTLGIVQKINYPCWVSDNSLVIKADNYEFVYHMLSSIDFSVYNVGSTQPLITQSSIKEILVPIPSQEVLQRFEETVAKMRLQIESNYKEILTLAEIRDLLLPRLMSGKIRVSGV
jgi:type I restriction enzyme S subunit